MKFIFALMILTLNAFTAQATEAEGGTGLSRPGEYYNPDYKCSVKDGLTLYLNVQPRLELSATIYNSRSNKVHSMYLDLYSLNQNPGLYQIESALDDRDVSFLDTNNGEVSVLNATYQLVKVCERLGHRIDEGPYFP